MNIVLVGGSGFLGRYCLRALGADGHHCRVLTRSAAQRRSLNHCPNTRLVETDVHDRDSLAAAFAGADAAVSMAGILNESPFGSGGFDRVHVQLPKNIAAACEANGIRRLLHISALNAGHGKSKYLASKGEAESYLRGRDGLDVTIFQPSVIFGPGDSFFNRFAGLLGVMPVLPLACAGSRMQPVYAGDVARSLAVALEDKITAGRSYELGGPSVFTLAELVRFTAETLGLRRWVVPQPDLVSRLQGAAMGLLPGAPFSLDNYRSLQTDNVAHNNSIKRFVDAPASVEAVVPTYLGAGLKQGRLREVRERARRR